MLSSLDRRGSSCIPFAPCSEVLVSVEIIRYGLTELINSVSNWIKIALYMLYGLGILWNFISLRFYFLLIILYCSLYIFYLSCFILISSHFISLLILFYSIYFFLFFFFRTFVTSKQSLFLDIVETVGKR